MEAVASWPVGLQLLGQAEAAQAFEACAGLDPAGIATPASAAAAGDCYKLTTPRGCLVYSAKVCGDLYWVYAAAGTGQDMTRRGLAAIEYQARQFGCRAVAFQTARRGLVRRTRAMGYQIAAPVGRVFQLEKALA